MKKALAIILSFVLILASSVPVFAANSEGTTVNPRYKYIITTDASLLINTNTGISTSTASLICESGYTAEVECELQRYVGSTWNTVKTWTNRGDGYATTNENWAVYSGYTYRIYVTYSVYNSSNRLLESTTATDFYYYPSNREFS